MNQESKTPRVTDIKQQVKNTDRYSVYVDGKYGFSLSVWQLGEERLKIGQELDNLDIERLKSLSDFGKLYDRTLNWAYMRLRSEREIDMYLDKITDDTGAQEWVKKRLLKLGLIDDQEFTRAWVASRRRSKHSSDIKLRAELRQKGIDESIVTQQLSESEVDELQALKELIQKKRKISRYQDDKKLIAYLARQGYRYADIKESLL